jgi:hypothetical protein
MLQHCEYKSIFYDPEQLELLRDTLLMPSLLLCFLVLPTTLFHVCPAAAAL